MDFDMILYIVLIIISVLVTIVKNVSKDEKERQAKKNAGRPVVAPEPAGVPQEQARRKPQSPIFQEQKNEPFSYETMSDRDFEQAFAQNMESGSGTSHSRTDNPAVNLTVSEDEVFKGIVWSEILKRKY